LSVGMVAEVAAESDVIMLLIPDHTQSEIYRESVLPNLLPGKTLMFAHGFNIHYEAIKPPESVDVSMVAPKAPGH
ncbi:MAG TPA: ketol-acid reductoisomerase, partial [Dehalococcoidia bacterium]|nr:ketol-acid reductoisomerase [Dehalococcoidia bacterium]